MLGNTVKRSEWPLVRKALYKYSPFSIDRSARIFPIDVPKQFYWELNPEGFTLNRRL